MNTLSIKKGDTVKIISGKDKGKTGKILNTDSVAGRVLVEGINLYKKHVKSKKQGEKGQVISVPRTLNFSNVQIVCLGCGKATRIGYQINSGKKTRYCKKCKTIL